MNEPRTSLTPEAQERLFKARDIVQQRLRRWGPMKVAHGLCVALVLLGAVMPLATVAQYGFFTSTTSGLHFYDLGLGGWLIVLGGLALSAAPFVLTFTVRSALTAFGAACVGFGMLLVPCIISGYTGTIAQLTAGYYAILAAYVILATAYWLRSTTEMTSQAHGPS